MSDAPSESRGEPAATDHEHQWQPKGPGRIADRCTVPGCTYERVRTFHDRQPYLLPKGDPPMRRRADHD